MAEKAPELKTRRPTGKPPWPMVLLAGVEKCGKSYAAAEFSASDLVDRTFFVELGEGYADNYGSIPGARYEIVEHDGSYVSIGRQLRLATQAPRPNGKPHAIVLDSGTELWDLLAEEAQAAANRRRGKDADGEAQITMDLWNVAKKRWRHIVDLLRQYDGPVIITARLEQVTVMSPNGQPTTAKEWKVRAEKNLPFECDAVVKMPEQGKAILTGVRSLLLRTGAGLEVADFSIEKLLTSMGIRPGETQARSYTAPRVEQPPQQPQDEPDRPQSNGRAQRSTSVPENDPWATESPETATPTTAPPAETAPAPERAETSQVPAAETPPQASPQANTALLKAVNVSLGKHGFSGDARFPKLAEMIGRPIASSSDLSVDEARGVLAALAKQAEAEAAAGPPEGWTREDADQLAADFLAGLQGSTNDAARVEIAGRIAQAVKARKISAEDRDTLLAAYTGVQGTSRKQPVGAGA